MFLLFEFVFVLLCLTTKKPNKCFLVLLGLQLFSSLSHYLVGYPIEFSTLTTFLNLIYIFITEALIILPWREIKHPKIVIKDLRFFYFYKRILFPILKINLVIFTIIWGLVWYFIPDVSALKQDLAFRNLYDSIPYFGFFYRYASITKYLGILAIPYLLYYMQVGDSKRIRESLICSLSVLIIGLATYNRAVMSLYILLLVCSYLLFKDHVNSMLKKKISKWLRIIVIGFVVFFLGISMVRFSSSNMDYYRDEIPKESVLKDPVSFSLLSYFSQGTVNGINFLELYDGQNRIWGKKITYDFDQMLAYFGLKKWDEENVERVVDRTYNVQGLSSQNKSDNFHGYAADLVANFGYVLALMISVTYFLIIRGSMSRFSRVSFTKCTFLILLLIIPINSIFYMSFSMLVFPIIFYFIVYWCPIKNLTEPTEKGTNLSASLQRFVILRLLQLKFQIYGQRYKFLRTAGTKSVNKIDGQAKN